MKKRTLIKICGLTTLSEIMEVNKIKPDFAGFVLFFEKSKRNNTMEHAKQLVHELSKDIKKVAVVVSPDLAQITEIEAAGFDYIQIHGRLAPDVFDNIHLPVLRALHVTELAWYQDYEFCPKIAGYVFDALEPGSGKTFDWNLIKDLPRADKLFFLAGGLRPENVQEAIHALHPDVVDVSSGVEYENKSGKDPEKMADFVFKVRNFHENP